MPPLGVGEYIPPLGVDAASTAAFRSFKLEDFKPTRGNNPLTPPPAPPPLPPPAVRNSSVAPLGVVEYISLGVSIGVAMGEATGEEWGVNSPPLLKGCSLRGLFMLPEISSKTAVITKVGGVGLSSINIPAFPSHA